MKPIKLIIIALLLNHMAAGQKAEPVYSFAKVLKPLPWYRTQKDLWQKEIKTNPQNSLGWFYYYKVARTLQRLDTTDKRTHDEKVRELDRIVEDMSRAVPESYEYNLTKFAHGGNDMTLLPYLKKAEQLGPDRVDHLDFMVNYAETEADIPKRDLYAKKWFESGTFSPGLLNYNYNVMSGLKENAIIVTVGDNDTYPIWMIQAGMDYRRDIVVLNTSLLYIDSYREKIFKKIGVKNISDYVYEIKKPDLPNRAKIRESQRRSLLEALVNNTQERPVYVALTACDGEFDFAGDKLYLTGLVYEYSKEEIDNIARLKKNFEQQYALDYIDKNFSNDISRGIVERCNMNYLVPMITLYDHYEESGDGARKEWISRKIKAIAKGTPQEKEVDKHLAK